MYILFNGNLLPSFEINKSIFISEFKKYEINFPRFKNKNDVII